MCGIVAFYGNRKHTLDVLVNGLKRLEYRGYDSSGIAILDQDNKVLSQKALGKVAELEKQLASANNFEGKIGIAHTRWATHGVPSVANAHPHSSNDGKIWLVHNGIIENYKELKSRLEINGIQFRSQTDTEVIANLIAINYEGDFKAAVEKSLKELVGAYALAIICTDEPDNLIATKFGAPLLIGIAEDEFIVASDASAIISKTKNVIYLEDGEIAEISETNLEISNFGGEILNKNVEKLQWDEDQANKEGYEHFLLKEITQQPKVLEDTIRGRIALEEGNVKFGGLTDIQSKLANIQKVVLLGVGTSFYAAKLGEMYFEKLANISAKAEISPEFRYKDNCINDKTWVIAISQSGETADTIGSIVEAKRKGALVTGIVNTVGSTISRITDAGVYQHIGPEMSVASTKAFTSASLLLLMHAVFIGRMRNLSFAQGHEILLEIQKIPHYLNQLFKQASNIESIAKKYYKSENMIYIGRNFNYPIAQEGALKIKELSYIHVEGFSSGELKHGPIALIDKDLPTVAIATRDNFYEKQISSIQEIIARQGPIIAICNDTEIRDITEDIIVVPKSNREEIQPLINNVALQLLAYYIANFKGLDIDKPRNLAKSVTVE